MECNKEGKVRLSVGAFLARCIYTHTYKEGAKKFIHILRNEKAVFN